MSNAKKLTLTELNKKSKELDGKKEILVSNGQYKVIIDKVFRQTKIQKLMLDYQEVLDQIGKIENLDMNIMKDLTFLFYTLIFRTFTDIPVPLDFQKMVSIAETLIDTGILEEVLNAFDQEQLANLNQELEKYAKNIPQFSQMIGDMMFKASVGDENADIQ